MHTMNLSHVLEGVTAIQVTHIEQELAIGRVSIDTRTMEKGDLFIAISGPNYNGHDYIDVALQKGAAALIVSKEVMATPVPTIVVEDTLVALQELATYHRRRMKAKVIAITGSSGKTTTKDMVSAILKSRYNVTATERNANNHIGLPLSLLNIREQDDVAVVEMGMNHLGEIEQLSTWAQPDMAIITNVGSAHIGHLGSKRHILRAKLEILNGLSEEGCLLLNGDDPMLREAEIPGYTPVYVSLDGDNDGNYRIQQSLQSEKGLSFEYTYQEQTVGIELPIFGKHHLMNAAMAIRCGLLMDIGIQDIADALTYFVGNSMRSEVVTIQGMTIIKDYYNANPESTEAAIELLDQYPTKGRRIAVIGEIMEMGDFAQEIHERIARKVSQVADVTFFIGDSHELFEHHQKSVKGYKNLEAFYGAFESFVHEGGIKEGDILLIKGSRSMRMEQVFEAFKKMIRFGSSPQLMRLPSSSARLYIDVHAMKKNIAEIQLFLKRHNDKKVDIMPIIKADAYGCGSETVINVYKQCPVMAVADANEAVTVQNVFPDKEILILYQPHYSEIESIVAHGFHVGVCHLEFVRRMNEEAAKVNRSIPIHIEIETGANRLGIRLDEIESFLEAVRKMDHIVVEGVYTHFICADSTDPEDVQYSDRQREIYAEAVNLIEEKVDTLRYRHACSSPAIITQVDAHYDMVRPGYMIYGYYPAPFLKDRIPLYPVLKLATNIIYLKDVQAGEYVSYGRTYQTKRKTRVATLAIGYADGLKRSLSNRGYVVVNGQKAPIIGRICMDMAMVDVTDIVGDVQVGDEVFIFDNVNITLDEVAELADTIGYEIIATIEDTVERIEIF